MNVRHGARLIVPALVALACLVTGCTATNAPGPSEADAPSPSASAGPTPTSSPTPSAFLIPDTTDPVQVAITLKYDGDDPSGEIIAGPAVLVADRPFSIEGQCEGDGVGFEVMTADGEKRVIADGDFRLRRSSRGRVHVPAALCRPGAGEPHRHRRRRPGMGARRAAVIAEWRTRRREHARPPAGPRSLGVRGAVLRRDPLRFRRRDLRPFPLPGLPYLLRSPCLRWRSQRCRR